MGTQDPNVIAQMTAKKMGHNVRIPAHQWHGIYDAYVVDSDANNPSVCPRGTCRVTIPAFSTTRVFGPVPYPGPYAPPRNQHAAAAFIDPQVSSPPYDTVRILCFYGWAGATWAEESITTGSADTAGSLGGGGGSAPYPPGPG